MWVDKNKKKTSGKLYSKHSEKKDAIYLKLMDWSNLFFLFVYKNFLNVKVKVQQAYESEPTQPWRLRGKGKTFDTKNAY